MQQSESEEFSVDSEELLDVDDEGMSQMQKRTPGVIIKKLDSGSIKGASEDANDKIDNRDNRSGRMLKMGLPNIDMDFLRQGTASSQTKTLMSLETIQNVFLFHLCI
jgi:hypothetical protein